jgi:hypothetical protein
MEGNVAADLGSSTAAIRVGNPDDITARILRISKETTGFAARVVFGECVGKNTGCARRAEEAEVG